MKKADNFDAKQWLAENKITFQSQINEEENPGLITFEQIKQACIEDLNSYTEFVFDDEEGDEMEIQNSSEEINSANNIDELVNILDGLGFNGTEAYDFIFGAIIK